MNNNISKQDAVFDEWSFNVWSDRRDWCKHCSKERNKLVFDDQTKTTRCSQCGHVETYPEANWKILQAKRYVFSQHMPGKYFFDHLSKAGSVRYWFMLLGVF
ncbi:MAG: hypothetical protein LBE76_01965 [Nitrososphaerota archaeon]|jgi:acetone carboxylase gamma subunit|nr:hypothetical protein [Nitrososphaerota archaeon]